MTTHCGEWRGAPEVAARLGRRGLEAVFRPRSIAVIGASRHRGSVGAEIFHNLLARGFQGVVYPVNPRFLRIARRVGRTKPIVAVKSGRTPAGMRAASSHTGSLAGGAGGPAKASAEARDGGNA
jgi:acyl-CoA synthetase (NDP forming)